MRCLKTDYLFTKMYFVIPHGATLTESLHNYSSFENTLKKNSKKLLGTKQNMYVECGIE